MKVITEERLKKLIQDLERKISDEAQIKYRLLENLLDYELEEIDTLTVSKLRPMCDAPKNIAILSKYNGNEMFLSVCLSADSTLSHYEGWLPIPIYKPEE